MIKRVISVSKTFIKYTDEVKCIDCVHCFRLVSKEPEYYCRKFGIKDLVIGTISYQKADKCRKNKYLCGTFGTYHENCDEKKQGSVV